VYGLTIVQNEEEEDFNLDLKAGLESAEFNNFIEQVAQLCVVTVNDLEITEKVAFFLNIYQCMYIHSFLRKIDEGQYEEVQNCSLFAKL